MTVIELTELAKDVSHALTSEQGRLLAASNVVRARRSSDPELWMVRDAGMVGAARVGDVDVIITPKLSVRRLFFLLGYTLKPRAHWRDDTVDLPEVDNLVPAFAQVLWRQIDGALRQGVMQGYHLVDAAEPMLRGRLRETEQVYRRHCLPYPLEVTYDEFTTDVAENRILRTAIDRMLRVPRVDDQSLRILTHLRSKLGDITPLGRSEPIPDWAPTRLNAHYHTALRAAEMTLHATSVDLGTGDVPVNGFLLEMWRLFEDFVTVALGEALQELSGGRWDPQNLQYLDEARRVKMRPDLVWSLYGRPRVVVDAKYTVDRQNVHLYQLMAYCSVLGLSRGHLVYAYGDEELVRHTVRRSGVELHCHALDLDQPPSVLLAQIRHIAAGLTPSSTRR